MKKTIIFICALVILGAVQNVRLNAEGRLEKRLNESVAVLNEIMKMPEEGIPKTLLSKCSAIAIFPKTLKGGLIWGGRYGQGVILFHDTNAGSWSPPAFFTIGEVSWGLQIGGEAIDLILVIFGDDALQTLLRDNFTLGGDANVAVGPVGRNAEINMDLLLKGGIFSYSRTKGLFAGASVKGAVITPNNVANRTFYGKELSPKDILFKKTVDVPDSAESLMNTLDKYSK